ncbi:acyl-CoA dehydrogenase family protein [Thiohalorhabdus sp. Cl-TMA]|uniref:Acyl-CoA dehydrogenase family protein n=1 Tax=Thiohalorhabdus methylotrophus TaxID=3242694 RepID=A0ABV4TYV4_9GAMM
MPIDFTLTPEQEQIQKTTRDFARNTLKPIVEEAWQEPDPQKAFVMTKPAYEEAYKAGFAMCFLPEEYGGSGLSNVDYLIAAEEISTVDPGFATTLLVNGLALLPILWFGTEEQKEKWLKMATSGEKSSWLAGWAVSEPPGAPGGTANFDHPGKHPVGIQTVAEHDPANGEYVINGEKYWPTNCGGWDLQGADVIVAIVRVDKSKGGSEGLGVAIIPRGTEGLRFRQPLRTVGQFLDQNNWFEIHNARIPEENVFAVGDGDLVIQKAFTWSGPAAGASAVGNARAAYEWALDWCKTYTAGSDKPIINYQNVGYLLTDIATKIEAARYLSWKGAHYLDTHEGEGHALGAMAKIYAGEVLKEAVWQCMQVVGINSVDLANPLEKHMRESLIFPLYDTGNMGMQRRKVWGVIADENYDSTTFMNNKPLRYKKSMEGYGAVAGKGVE